MTGVPAVPGQVLRRGALWGAFAWLPAACVVAIFAAIGFAPQALAAWLRAAAAEPLGWLVTYLAVGPAHCIAFVLHALRNTRLGGAQRARWVLALAFASGIAAPLYWWRGFTARAY